MSTDPMTLRGHRVLVTGATGFVGRHTVTALVQAGAEVCATSRHGAGLPDPSLATDLLDHEAVRRLVEQVRPRHILHLGGAIARPGLSFLDLIGVNAAGTESVLAAAAARAEVESVVVAGSSAVYARNAKLPLSESTRIAPSTAYGVAKAAQELVVGSWRSRSRCRVTVARLFNVVGPGQSPDLALSAFAGQVVGAEHGGPAEIRVGRLDTTRDYVDVRDAVAALALLVERGTEFGEYNVASGVGRSVQEGLDVLLGLAACPITVRSDPALVRPADVPVQIGDSTRLRAATGWAPIIPFERSVADLLEYRRREPEAP